MCWEYQLVVESPPLTWNSRLEESKSKRESEWKGNWAELYKQWETCASLPDTALPASLSPRVCGQPRQRLSRGIYPHGAFSCPYQQCGHHRVRNWKCSWQKAQGRVLRGSILLWQGVAEGEAREFQWIIYVNSQAGLIWHRHSKSGRGYQRSLLRSHLRCGSIN